MRDLENSTLNNNHTNLPPGFVEKDDGMDFSIPQFEEDDFEGCDEVVEGDDSDYKQFEN